MHPVQVLKNHLRLIRGSMILDDIRTRFLGGDLYARATYTRVYTVTCLLQKDTQYEKLTEFQSSLPISYEWLVCCICLLIALHFKDPYFRFQLHCVVLTFYSPLIHPFLHISPNCSLYLHSHHLSLPQSFIPDSRPISSTNIFLHVCANQFYCSGSVLS